MVGEHDRQRLWDSDKEIKGDVFVKIPLHNTVEFYFSIAGVPPGRFKECTDWAFGGIFFNDSMQSLLNSWNKRHSEIFYFDKEAMSRIDFNNLTAENWNTNPDLVKFFVAVGMAYGLAEMGKGDAKKIQKHLDKEVNNDNRAA